VRRRVLCWLAALLLAVSSSAARAQYFDNGPKPLNFNSLFSASSQNQTEEVVRILRRGDNPNGLDTTGHSPLGYAALYGNTDMTKALLASGARPDFRDKFGNTALHWAATNGQIEVLRLLVAAKAPIDAPNKQGMTPLMMAADGNKIEAVRALLAAGADPKKEDFSGRDAVGWAQGKAGALRLLQQAAK
jgi:ankyrin repeat protein